VRILEIVDEDAGTVVQRMTPGPFDSIDPMEHREPAVPGTNRRSAGTVFQTSPFRADGKNTDRLGGKAQCRYISQDVFEAAPSSPESAFGR
jgi:hypothetical protein